MFYAIDEKDTKIQAYPKGKAACPACAESVIAKCGKINVWHWAHKSKTDCDIWSEHETQWHLAWKSYFPVENVEVLIEKDGVKHRADILTKDGIVIELQHSFLSPDQIAERETFYGNMIWIFDTVEPHQNDRLSFKDKADYKTFRWKHPRKHLFSCEKPAYWDIGFGRLFNPHKAYLSERCVGWGYGVSSKYFIWKHGGNPKSIVQQKWYDEYNENGERHTDGKIYQDN